MASEGVQPQQTRTPNSKTKQSLRPTFISRSYYLCYGIGLFGCWVVGLLESLGKKIDCVYYVVDQLLLLLLVCVYWFDSYLGCAYLSTQGGGASHDGFGVPVSTTFPLFQNHTFAHDVPHPSWVERKVHLTN